MKICIEAQTLNHWQRSGLMTYTEGLVNGLARNDHDNDYSLIYYSLKRSGSEMPGPSAPNFKKVVLPVPDREFWGRQVILNKLALPGYFRKNKIRVFHRAHGYTMAEGKDVFKILTVHDLRTLTIGDSQWAQNIDHYRKTLTKIDMCTVVSECTKRDLIQHFKLDPEKIRVIYLGADERFRPADKKDIEALKSKFQLNAPFLLSVGSVPRKNIEGIIRGFAGSAVTKDHLLVLTCNQDVEKYKSLARELNIEDRVRFCNKLADNDIITLYSCCAGFVFPSLYEGFGLPIVEAMQCGAPVITSNVSSCPEVAGDAAILVDPYKVEEISDAINQLCRNTQLRQALIVKGFERAKFFSWARYAQMIRDVYAMAG